MEQFPSEKEVPFNKDDIAILQERKRVVKMTAVAGCIIMPVIAVAGIQFFLENENKLQIQISTTIALILFTLLLSRRDYRNLESYIQSGMKTIVTGTITRKYNNHTMDKSARIYVLYIEDYKIRVSLEIYERYQVNDKAEFHIFKPLYNLLLYEVKH